MNKIKQFLIDRGYYRIPKWLRHVAGSAFLAWVAVGIISKFTGDYNFVAGASISWVIGLVKELIENRGDVKAIGYDMTLNLFGILLSLLPWFIEVGI